jgi:hypothetical protein
MTAIVKWFEVNNHLSLFPCAVAADELESKQTKPPEDRSVIVTLYVSNPYDYINHVFKRS